MGLPRRWVAAAALPLAWSHRHSGKMERPLAHFSPCPPLEASWRCCSSRARMTAKARSALFQAASAAGPLRARTALGSSGEDWWWRCAWHPVFPSLGMRCRRSASALQPLTRS